MGKLSDDELVGMMFRGVSIEPKDDRVETRISRAEKTFKLGEARHIWKSYGNPHPDHRSHPGKEVNPNYPFRAPEEMCCTWCDGAAQIIYRKEFNPYVGHWGNLVKGCADCDNSGLRQEQERVTSELDAYEKSLVVAKKARGFLRRLWEWGN